MDDEPHWLSTAQAAEILGVKAATVYAYVSRGQLSRHPGPDGRTSRFDRGEVRRLAARTRHGGRAGSLDVVLDTGLSLLMPDGALYYRGRDATGLARTHSFEDVAELLWADGPDTTPAAVSAVSAASTDGPDAGTTRGAWRAPSATLDVGRAVQRALPDTVRPADRLRATVAALAGIDPLRHDRRPAAVAAVGRVLVAAMVDCLPRRHDPTGVGVADRLWAALARTPPTAAQRRALNAALILVADHELAASALAARVAASVRGDPYLTVLTGLAVAGGTLHGGAVTAVESLLGQLAAGAAPATLVDVRLAGGEPVPGFGHRVYTGRDPRADTLLDLATAVGGDPALVSAVDELVALVGRHDGPPPNYDLAVAALAARCELRAGSAEAVFLVGRTAGLIGHTIEEYRHVFRFRPRAVYTGPPPGRREPRPDDHAEPPEPR